MVCISLNQPYATLILENKKTIIETNCIKKHSKLVGQRIGIHATMDFVNYAHEQIINYIPNPEFYSLVKDNIFSEDRHKFGYLLCTAFVYDADYLNIRDSKKSLMHVENCRTFGLFIRDIKRLENPIFCNGRKGSFEIKDSELTNEC